MSAMLIPLIVLVAPGTNLLANPGFEEELNGWVASGSGARFDTVELEQRKAARLIVPVEAEVSWPMIVQSIPARPGDLFEARVEAWRRNVTDGFGVYIAIEFHGADEKRISFSQTGAVAREETWSELKLRSAAPPGTVSTRLCLILNGHGEARFDDAQFALVGNTRCGPLEGPVTVTVTNDVVCDSILGFGFEDDGWFYNAENASYGITEEDVDQREGRITWMDPDWIRMFFWYKDWNPSGDWTSFDFDSDNMRSHYRTLELYQELDAVINVVGVEWGIPDPYGEPAKAAQAIGALFEHLIRDKGFTCVRQWTLTNEPNGAFASHMGYRFDRYLTMHQIVAKEFLKRGLDVEIVGSDDTAGLSWFEPCVNSAPYYELADLFVSHRYFPFADRILAPFFYADRLSLIADKTPRKRFAVAEFGFQDARSGTLENPLMETYPYAVWTTAFMIEGLNRGVAGFTIWCLSEVYYPGNGFMNYGLWNFKDDHWKPRPVYHAIANFTRLTERGDMVRKCSSTHPKHVLAVVVGDVLFWVNRYDEEATITVTGAELLDGRVMTESTLIGDRECGAPITVKENGFKAPTQSFGWVRVK